MIETASHDQGFSVADVKTLDGAAVERLLEDGEEVSLQAAFPLLHRVAEEEQVVSERHQELIFGVDCEGEDVITFHSILFNHSWRENNLLGGLEGDLLSVGRHLLDHPHRVVAVAANEAAAKGDQARYLAISNLAVLIGLPDSDQQSFALVCQKHCQGQKGCYDYSQHHLTKSSRVIVDFSSASSNSRTWDVHSTQPLQKSLDRPCLVLRPQEHAYSRASCDPNKQERHPENNLQK